MHRTPRPSISLVLLLAVVLFAWPASAAEPPVELQIDDTRAVWYLSAEHSGATLALSGPAGVIERHAAAGEPTLSVDLVAGEGQLLAAGTYAWQLRTLPVVDAELRQTLERARAAGDSRAIEKLRQAGAMPRGLQASGHLTVDAGRFVVASGLEPSAPSTGAEGSVAPTSPDKDQLFIDDLIVIANQCVGFSCVNNESFGEDVLRLKDVNTRIHFQDTSTGAYPTTDWRITANESTSGGANKFSIDDVTAGNTPFTIRGGARNNAVYVDTLGRVGLGTSTPLRAIHMVSGDTPGLRLEQDGSSSFAPFVWDVAGNETNFFIQDTTNGTLPLRIRPDAPDDAIYVEADGRIGMGTNSPLAALHVRRIDGDTKILVDEGSTTTASRNLLELRNRGATQLVLTNTNASASWRAIHGGNFLISADGTGGNELSLATTGDMTIRGTLTELSDVASKENFAPVDPRDVLDRLLALPIGTWNYRDNPDTVRHLGPTAQDFYAGFGLGADDTGVAARNLAAVAMVAVKGVVAEMEAENADLRQQNALLEERLAAVEERLRDLSGDR